MKIIKAFPHEITFPIFGRVNGKTRFIATGFFFDYTGGIITAKHALDEQDIDPDTKYLIIQISKNKFIPRVVEHTFFHPEADICLGKLNMIIKNGNEVENPVWDYEFSIPQKDSIIRTYAYPNTTKHPDKRSVWNVKPETFKGKIIDFHERCPTCHLVTECIQTDMEIISGSSGGPVFNEEGKVIGVNSVSYDLEEDESPIGFITPLKFIKEIEVLHEDNYILFGDLLEIQKPK